MMNSAELIQKAYTEAPEEAKMSMKELEQMCEDQVDPEQPQVEFVTTPDKALTVNISFYGHSTESLKKVFDTTIAQICIIQDTGEVTLNQTLDDGTAKINITVKEV